MRRRSCRRIVVMTTAHKIAIALVKCTDEGEWWKSIKVKRKTAEVMQIETLAITAGPLLVQRLRQTLTTFCMGNLGLTLITVFPSLWELQWCSSLPRQFGQVGPGPQGMRSLASAATSTSTLGRSAL